MKALWHLEKKKNRQLVAVHVCVCMFSYKTQIQMKGAMPCWASQKQTHNENPLSIPLTCALTHNLYCACRHESLRFYYLLSHTFLYVHCVYVSLKGSHYNRVCLTSRATPPGTFQELFVSRFICPCWLADSKIRDEGQNVVFVCAKLFSKV